jgi:membrane protease YdiL (CAAX protease family)
MEDPYKGRIVIRMKKIVVALIIALAWPVVYLGAQVVVSIVSAIAYVFDMSMHGVEINLGDAQGMLSDLTGWITVYTCLLACVIVIIAAKAGRHRLRDRLKLKAVPALKIILLLVLGVALNMFTGYMMEVIPFPDWMLVQYEGLVGDNILGDSFLMTFISTAVLVPIAEELVFRSMSFEALRRGMNFAAAFALQCVIFAAAHVIPLQMIYVLFAAAALGLVYVWTESVIASILVHIGYNGLSVVLGFIQAEAGTAAEMTNADLMPFILGSAAVIAVCMTVLWRTRVKKEVGLEKILLEEWS